MKKYFIFIILILQYFIAISQVSNLCLFAKYTFNGNIIDESGNGNNEINGDVTLTNDRFDNSNSAYYMNENNFLSINGTFNFNNVNQYDNKISLCVWVYLDDYGPMRMLRSTDLLELSGFHIGINKIDHKLIIGGYHDSIIDLKSKSAIGIKKWYYIVGTFDDKNIKMYINGNLENSKPADLIIGYCSVLNFGDGRQKAKIDDVFIYNRVLSESEVKSSYLEVGNEGLSYPAYSMYKNKINYEFSFIKPKGEFESEVEYNKRVLTEKNKISIKYMDLFSEKTKALIKSIQQSYKIVELKIEELGYYNTKNEEFPMTISGSTLKVKVPISEAQEFKENYKIAKVTASKQLDKEGSKELTFNIKITNPKTGSIYFFGEQYAPLYIEK